MATPEKRMYDGDRAREVLNNEAFTGAFDAIRQEYTDAWMNSPALDAEGREKLYWMIKQMDKLRATFVSMLEDGKMARVQLEHEANLLAKQRAYGVQAG